MRILMLIAELGYGGAEGAFVRLARELTARNQVEIVVFRESYANAAYTSVDLPGGLQVHRLDRSQQEGWTGRWMRRFWRLRALKAEFGPNATISFLTGPNFLNVIARGPGRAIVSIRGSRKYDAHSGAFRKWWYRWILDPVTNSLADAVVCVSAGLTREISGRRATAPSRKFSTISGYVDADSLIAAAAAPIEPEVERLCRYPLIAAAGRFSPEKGFQHLIRVFAGVHARSPEARLLLIGDGPFHAELERACRTHGLRCALQDEDFDGDANVIFLGYRAEPHRYFRIARAFALPSSSEGFPNILIEALASGVPVVAGDVPWGSREVLGLPADPANRPYPRPQPLLGEYGALMPRIDSTASEQAWIDVLSDYLGHTEAAPAARVARRARVRELSCQAAAAKWEALLQDLDRRGVPTLAGQS